MILLCSHKAAVGRILILHQPALLLQELEDSCPVCVRPYNHGTSWDSGQVAGSPLCYISRAAIAAQKLEVLGAELLGPSRKSSS